MTMPAVLRSVRRAAARASATFFRILVIFSLLLFCWDAFWRFAVQVAPASFWFEIDRVEILPPGDVVIVWRRSHVGDLPVVSVVELLGEDGSQPCASSGRRVIERNTDRAVVPIDRLLPDCRWDALPDGAYSLMVTASLPAGSATDKSITVQSANAILVVDGAMIGSTSSAHVP